MKNIFDELSTIDFKERFNMLLSQTTVPKIKVLAFVYSDNTKPFLLNNRFASYTESIYGNGYWFINLSLFKIKFLTDKNPFIFGYIHNSKIILIKYIWENKCIKKEKMFIIGKKQKKNYEFPFFSEGTYIPTASKCDVSFKKDLILNPSAKDIIKNCNEGVDKLLGITPKEYLSGRPVRVGMGAAGLYSKMLSCINNIYESYSQKTIRDNISKLDFDKISRNKNLNNEFILAYRDKLNMRKVFQNNIISEDFLYKNYNKFNHKYFLQYQDLSEDFIESIAGRLDADDWRLISFRQKLSENFIRKYKDVIDWQTISSTQILSLEFIREFQDSVCWDDISAFQDLNMSFIKEFQDRINLKRISHHKLTKEFILKNIEKLNLYLTSQNQTHLAPALRDKLLLLSYLT